MNYFEEIESAQAEIAKWSEEKQRFFRDLMPCLTCLGRGYITLWDRAARCHCNPEKQNDR